VLPTFQIYIFDKNTDSVIIPILAIFWFYLSLKGKERIVSSVIYGSVTAIALFTNFGPLQDAIVLISLPIIASFFIYQQLSTKNIIKIQITMFLSFFSVAVLCIVTAGVIVSVLTFSLSSGPLVWLRNYSVDIFLLISSFSPALMFFLIGGSTIKLFTTRRIIESKNRTNHYQVTSQKLKQNRKFLFLSLFMLLSIFLALIPHQSFINNENELVGADTVAYVKTLNSIEVYGQDELLHQVFEVQFSGDRPLSFLLFSAVLSLFPDNPYHVIDHLPLIFSPLLVLIVFLLSRELTSNDTVSLLASFLTAISFHPLIGIYSGLYANWLALIFGYLFLIFVIRFLKKPTGINYLTFSVFLFLTMFTHVYTWTILSLFMGIFLIASSRFKIFEKRSIALVFLIIVASIAFDTGRSFMTESQGGIENNVLIASTNASFENLATIWSNLTKTSLVYAGGQFGNFLILSLCIYWLLRSNLTKMPNLFIAIFLSIGLLPILLGGDLIQSRVLYNIPFQIPAALGMAYLYYQNRSPLLVISISVWILLISIQSITNFI